MGLRDAVGANLADLPDIVSLIAAAVDEVADEREDDENNDGTGISEELDGEMPLAPFLADLLETDEDDESSETNATGRSIPVRKTLQDVADDVENS